jgi:uncharacterized protein (TIGR01319 family)
MDLILAIDFGSTFTKAVVLCLEKEELVASAYVPSTVDTDITIGLFSALEQLRMKCHLDPLSVNYKLGCSSAAGGLRMVAIGLVRELTTKAAEEACLGAGAKLVGSFAYGISEADMVRLEELSPDIVLLCGGTDGGNTEVITHNAEMLAKSALKSPIIVAGNKMAQKTVQVCLENASKECFICENVLPELDRLEVEPARELIRRVFMERIVHAKGFDKAQDVIGSIIMPTPRAVLKGCELLAQGTGGQPGLGELVGIDVGGATIDIYSISNGHPTQPGVIVKGLPEPYIKRTVEGDIGIRYNAEHILERLGKDKIMDVLSVLGGNFPAGFNLEAKISYMTKCVDCIPQDEHEFLLDSALARIGVDIAMERHCGTVTEMYAPTGRIYVQRGKDLTKIDTFVATGGIFTYGRRIEEILRAACASEKRSNSLRPIYPERLLIDKDYILFAIGLAAEIDAEKALKIMMKSLLKL